MEGKRNRGEVTAELSEKVWARLCRENALVASEVWVDDARRVDFVAYRPHRPRDRSSNHATAAELESGTFTFVEVKSCMDDFTSGHGRTFEGDENWLVCPLEPADVHDRAGHGRVRLAEHAGAGQRRPDPGDLEAPSLADERLRGVEPAPSVNLNRYGDDFGVEPVAPGHVPDPLPLGRAPRARGLTVSLHGCRPVIPP